MCFLLNWELIKGSIRNTSIKYASRAKKQKEKREQEICKHIQNIESNTNNNDSDLDRLNTLKLELDAISTERINGIILRSKAQYVENNEKNSKYFASLEKRHYEQKTITKIKTNQSTIITDLKDIISEQRNFYQQLYKARPTIESELKFLDTPITQLNNDEINICEGLLTEHECTESLNGMGLNKSPGSDGITVEFYKAFWDILKMHYVKSVFFFKINL